MTDERQRLRDLAISQSGFIFDPFTGSTFSANAAGLLILDELKEGRGREAIVAALEERFEVAGEDLERDLDEFLLLLRRNSLLPQDYSI